MIVFLTGPTGSGKTDTSWELLSALDDIVFLDCDWFASRSRFSWKDLADVESVYRAIRSQIQFHLGEGRKQFVITLTLEMAPSFKAHYNYFAELHLPMYAFRLYSRPEIIKRRINSRDRLQKDEEAANAILQQAEFDRLFPDEKIFLCVDTSDLASDEVAKLLVHRINGSFSN